MASMEPGRWDDYVLAGLLLVIGVPRAILALCLDHPLGVEGSLSLVCAGLGLVLLAGRRR